MTRSAIYGFFKVNFRTLALQLPFMFNWKLLSLVLSSLTLFSHSDRSQEANVPKEEGSESEGLAQITDERGQRGPPDTTPLSRDGSH